MVYLLHGQKISILIIGRNLNDSKSLKIPQSTSISDSIGDILCNIFLYFQRNLNSVSISIFTNVCTLKYVYDSACLDFTLMPLLFPITDQLPTGLMYRHSRTLLNLCFCQHVFHRQISTVGIKPSYLVLEYLLIFFSALFVIALCRTIFLLCFVIA